MAKKIADLLIKIGADSYEFTKMSAEVRKQLNALGKDLQGFGKSMSLYFTAPLTAAAGASVHLADVQMQAEKRLLTALKGREDVQKRLIKQAGELQSRSILGDEVIIGQQAFLASLGLTEQQINDTIEASAQLAAATGMTLDSAVKNLAKTYGGLTGELGESIPALKQFTAEELKNGAAVKFALENYKGFAEAIAETGLGPMQQLKNSLGDLGEQIGVILMPMVQQIVGWLQDFVAWLQQLSPATKTTIVAIGGLVAAIGPLSLGLGTVLKMLPLLKAGLMLLHPPILLVVGVVSSLAFGLFKLFTASSDADIANKKLRQTFSNTDAAIASERYQVDLLFARLKAATEGTIEYAEAKQSIIDKYGNYLSKLGDEKTALENIALAYRTITSEIERASRARAFDAISKDVADTYTEKKSNAYEDARKILEKKFKGQKTSEGIDLPTYYLMKLKPVIMDEGEVTAEIQEIIKKFNVEKIVSGVPGSGFGQTVKVSNRMNEILRSVRDARKIADDTMSAAAAKWSVANNTIADISEDATNKLEEENNKIEATTGLIGELQEKITKLEEAKKNATSIYEIRNINLELAKTREELEDLQNVDKRGRIIGNTSGLLQGKITPLQFDPNAINPPAVEWNAAADSFDENAHDLEQRFEESIFDFGTAVQRFLANTAVTIGESIGSLLGGDSTFEDLLATAGALMGQFLKSLGKQLIELGTMMLGIKKALEAAFSNPYAAIAIGIAAVAMGSALISSFNKRANKGIALANGGLAYGPTMALVGDNRGAGSDPEVIAPLSKLRQYGLGRQSIEFIGGQFRLSGSDLLLSIRREDAKVSYINAGV